MTFKKNESNANYCTYLGYLATILFLVAFSFTSLAQSIVQQHGLLKVVGNQVVDKNNQSLSLAGNSLFWSNFGEGAKFYNEATVNHLATDWKTDIVRASMGVEDSGGYISNPTREKNKVKAVVNAAIDAGVYVIIDWHSHNAEQYQAQAIEFFTEMATLYGNNDHVIYEVYNEPIAQSWQTVKTYAEAVIDAIRAKDPDNLIIVGSPQWSQKVVEASNNPIDKTNIAYTLHFYAGTHKQFLRDQATQAMNNGIAIFVTEWGAVNADGNGAADIAETNIWMQYLKDNNISHANWSVSDKAESASVVTSASGVFGLTRNDLTATGIFLKDIIKNWNAAAAGDPTPPVDPCAAIGLGIDVIIQAEDFCAQSGIQTETTTDTGGGINVGYIDNGDYLRYRVNIPADGTYEVQYRVASIVNTGQIQFKDGTTVLKTSSIPLTNGWQSWTTIRKDVTLTTGSKTIELYAVSGKFNINWLKISPASTTPPPPPPPPTGGNDCTFGTPAPAALPTTGNISYANVHVLGNNGPDLSNVTNMTINWNLTNNGLWQFSMNTNNAKPNWWADLRSSMSQTFNATQPAVTFTNSGFPGLDGDYWVTNDGENFVMVSKTEGFTIYFSNSNTRPNCNSAKNSLQDINSIPLRLYPIPSSKFLYIAGINESVHIRILTSTGKTVKRMPFTSRTNEINIANLAPGNYFAEIQGEHTNKTIQFIKM